MWLLKRFKSSKVKFLAVISTGLVVLAALFGFVGGSAASRVDAGDPASDDADKQPDEPIKPGAWSGSEGVAGRVQAHQVYRHEQSRRLLLEVEVELHNNADFTYRMPNQWFDLTLPDGRVLTAEQLLQNEATGRIVIEPDQETTVKVLFWLGPSGLIPDGNLLFGIHEAGPSSATFELGPVDVAGAG